MKWIDWILETYLIRRLAMHQPSPLVVDVDITGGVLRSVWATCIVMMSWVHPPTVRSGCLPLGCLARHLNWVLLGLSLFVRSVKGLALSMRLTVWVCRIERDTLSILVCRTHNLFTLWMRISNNGCNSIDVIKTSVVSSIIIRGMSTSRVVSCQRLSPDDSTHDSSLLLIRHVLSLGSLTTMSSSFWRMERSAKLTISTTNRSMALSDSAAINHLSFLLVQNLLRKGCWNMTSRGCSSSS